MLIIFLLAAVLIPPATAWHTPVRYGRCCEMTTFQHVWHAGMRGLQSG